MILGNHRDAWVAGAVDPSSGTAAVLETGRALAMLRDAGWKPRRTIVWCSWDAEEYMLLGSTEWAEQHDHLLRNRAVSYINLDSAVSGGLRGFGAQATPQFDDLIRDVAKTVYDPEGEYDSMYDAWKAKQNMPLPSSSGHSAEHDSAAGPEPQVGRLGSGSDYTPFIQHLGIPSVALGYSGEYPVYHSQYDSLYWMENFGDERTENCPTGFCRHAAISTYVGALVMRLADDKVLPFNYTNYAVVMRGYADDCAPPPLLPACVSACLSADCGILHSARTVAIASQHALCCCALQSMSHTQCNTQTRRVASVMPLATPGSLSALSTTPSPAWTVSSPRSPLR